MVGLIILNMKISELAKYIWKLRLDAPYIYCPEQKGEAFTELASPTG